MRPRTQIVVALLSLVAAVAVGLYVHQVSTQMVTVARVVTPALPIPAGVSIGETMLAERDVPRALLSEDIYVRAADLVGRVAVVPLRPGMVVYRSFAVAPEEYRMVDDPALEVVSFPVDPARAVGGQIRPGQRVDIWRLVSVRSSSGTSATDVAAGRLGTADLLVEHVLVVDVRGSAGQAVARSSPEQTGPMASSQTNVALQILTVAVPRKVAQEILTLVAEEESGAELWVSLAPLIGGESTSLPGGGR